MIKYLKEILQDLKLNHATKNLRQKILALESAIEILEKIRRDMDGNSTK